MRRIAMLGIWAILAPLAFAACATQDVADDGEPVDAEQAATEPTGEAADEAGVSCGDPSDCVKKCVAEKKWCWAERAEHPFKAPLVGVLEQCIDTFPRAKYGGSYTCHYRYPNGDVCVFSYGAKLGPIHPPAPPPLCIYKTK